MIGQLASWNLFGAVPLQISNLSLESAIYHLGRLAELLVEQLHFNNLLFWDCKKGLTTVDMEESGVSGGAWGMDNVKETNNVSF